MMNEQTVNRMKLLRLSGMSIAYSNLLHDKSKIKMSNDEFIAYLIDIEFEDRLEKRVSRLKKKAGFKVITGLGEIDTGGSRGFDRQMMMRIAELTWIKRAENILITGATGSGKTFISNAIGHHACIAGKSVGYFMMGKLLRKYKESLVDMTLSKLLKSFEKMEVLILDDLGLNPIDKDACRFLFEIIDDRYRKYSTIISSQIPVKLWPKVFEDKTLADAIIDRLVHNAYKIELNSGKSSRRALKTVAK